MSTTRTERLLIFLALFVPYSYFNHSDGWNQSGRLAELHAIVIQHTLAIDAYHERTGDKALINGHYYSEKAPAIGLLALPMFAATALIERALGIDPDGPRGWRISEWVVTAGSVGLLAALGGVAFHALLISRLFALTAPLATFALFLGSFTWPYATSLFSHAGTIGLLAIALWAALGPASPRRDYIAGLAAGLAVAAEYPSAIPCAVLGLYLGYAGWRRMWRFALATTPAAVLILLNNYAKTGSPLALAYGAHASFPEISAAHAFGFALPDVPAMTALLWGEYRGLFFWCPALLMALPGLIELFQKERAVAVMVTLTVLLILLQVGSFFTPFGGNAIGPRYLAPALPFIGLAAAYGIKRWPKIGLILVMVSIAIMGTVTAIAIDPPGDVMNPFQAFYLVRIREARFAENLGTLIGLPVWLSLLIPFAAPAVAAWYLFRAGAPR